MGVDGCRSGDLRKVMNEEGGDCDEEEGRSRSGPGRDGTRGRV
jgi:hypothetical protein